MLRCTYSQLHWHKDLRHPSFRSQHLGPKVRVPVLGTCHLGPKCWGPYETQFGSRVPRSKDPLRAFAPKMTVIILVTIGRRGAVSFKKIVLCSELKLYWISISNLLTRELSSSTKSKSKYRQTHLVTNMCVIPKENSLKFYYSRIAYLVICLIKSQFRVVFI